MKRCYQCCAGICFFLVFITGCLSNGDRSEVGGLQIGMAEVNITPPVGYRMAGYYDERFSTGIHDPLKAKAIVIQQGTEKIALVFCDLVGLSLPVSKTARQEASAACGIPVTNISIFATHSHTGPLFNDVRGTYFNEDAIARYGYDPHQTIDYASMLTDRVITAIEQANASVAPATLSVGIGHQAGLPFNRRYYMKNGKVAFNPGKLNPKIVGPAGPVDSDVGMLRVEKNGRRIGGLTEFAMHADTLGGTDYSADYPFYIEQGLRKAFGRKYISMFGAGTCGDLNNVDVSKPGPVKGQDVAKGLGDAISKTVIESADKMAPIAKPSLAARSRLLMAPLQEVTPEKVAAARAHMSLLGSTNMDFYAQVEMVKALDLDARGKVWPMEVQVFRLDADTAIVGLPAEIFVEFGLTIKKQSPFKNTLVIALDNDRPCYVPTLKAFKEGSYEVVNSRVKPGVGEQLTETAVELLKELKP